MAEKRRFQVAADEGGQRLDVFLTAKEVGPSRSFVRKLIDGGLVQVNNQQEKASYKVSAGDVIQVEIPELEPIEAKPQTIALDIIYEDEDVVVVNKPKGMVVHPAPGNPDNTLVNALLAHCQNLSGIGGKIRPGIVHRLDKDTSGVLVVAKNDLAHLSLAKQIKDRIAERRYLAIVHGSVKEDQGTISTWLGRHPVHRKKMAVLPEGKGKPAVTHYRVKERFGDYTLVEAKLETGRTHQIRVHMAYLGHPVVGDEVYGPKKAHLGFDGQALHAAELGVYHPRTGQWVTWKAPLPEDFVRALNYLRRTRE